jgi:cbb3-type cytochrome oxidase subunit 1
MYLTGMVIMAWNVFMTATAGKPANATIPTALAHA